MTPWPWLETLQHAFAFEPAVVTPYTFATVLVPALLGFYVMAVLVQLPHASFYRAALLPVLLWMCFRASMSLDFSWDYPGYAFFNQGLALCMLVIAMRSMTWVFAQHLYSRLPLSKLSNGTANGNTCTKNDVSVSCAMWNAFDLVANLREIGWNTPQKIHTRTPFIQVESRLIFVLRSFRRSVLLIIAYDILCKFSRSLGPDTFGSPNGGTIFDPLLPPPQRYLKSTIVTLLTGFIAYLVIDTVYQVHAMLYTILFQQHPSQWPPLFDNPWLSTSLTSFWGRRWHQLFRSCFVTLGSKPFEKRIRRAGNVIGAFAISGVLHDLGARGMRRGSHMIPILGFFLVNGVGVTAEHAWKWATGRRVGGLAGWSWTAFWLLLWGNFLVDAWAQIGLLGCDLYPAAYGPCTLFLNWISGGK